MKIDVLQRMQAALDQRAANNSLRSLIIVPPDFTDFTSNDYLGLTRSIAFTADVRFSLEKIHPGKLFGSGGSRLLSGNNSITQEAEKYLATHFRSESGLIFNSGFIANCGIFASIPKKGDTVLYDELIHASVRDGLKMSNARSWSFRHNDLDHLAELLKKTEGVVFVATEAVFSMDGDVCPLKEIVALCKEKNAHLILDEAHSTGIFGKEGEGLAVELGFEKDIFIRLYTFGKAMGCQGAFVACTELAKNYLVNFCRPFIYTTASSIHDVVVMRSAVGFVKSHSELRSLLFENVRYFRGKAAEKKLPVYNSESPIQVIVIPGNPEVKRKAEWCRNNKLDVRAVLSPTVPEGSERLRIIIHAFNTHEEIDHLIRCLSAG